MSKFEITFELTQHTPIIHFQADQAGATLRATELKPKFDRYLREKFRENKVGVPATWKTSKNHEALDYKVKIIAKDVKSQYINRNNGPMFFANMGPGSDKLFSETRQPIVVEFFSFQIDLLAELKKHFSEFLFVTNFGTRQSKGYGSFFLSDLSHIPEAKTPYLEIPKYLMIENEVSVLHFINYYYQLLKSGINYFKFQDYSSHNCRKRVVKYEHGFLKQYVINKLNYTWEKPWIKSQFIQEIPLKKGATYKFARAFLGLYPSAKFEQKNENCINNYRFSLNVTHENRTQDGEIKRFKSPIIFKPILFSDHWKVFIHVSPIPDQLLDQTFIFDNNRSKPRLETPSKPIDLADL
ncbi:hypothetical protein, partial [uncultured Cyclobacterium sp.]|uniref:hypothetical protein n=1 Tax=uncultured Cyclobacterium sp. TaxID=453820 RepID=UPI0030EED46B